MGKAFFEIYAMVSVCVNHEKYNKDPTICLGPQHVVVVATIDHL